ncbi:PKS-NRPS hybrid synthetase cheA-like [Rutidosis leptorrhynchoides]|uniref:PKS-NRPS hybrid synthetase cheA-like n=1 Tax=Rutidosis leptorrhynchoides TaxID=125765 RepID=UPI003A99D384
MDTTIIQVFNSREELTEWVKNEARSHSQVIVIRRSKEKKGYVVKIEYACERGGVSRSKSTPEKSKPCKKIDCKFKMVAKFSKTTGVWSIKMKNSVHNHERIMYMEGHAYAARLTNDEWRLVADLSSKNVRTGEILATLKKQNPENVSSSKTVYNAKAKLRTIFQANRTPIQVVMSFLKEKGCVEVPPRSMVKQIRPHVRIGGD